MDREREKRLTEFIALLKQINESIIETSLYRILNKDKSFQFYERCFYYSEYCRCFAIKVQGTINEEYQELLEDNGFSIEIGKTHKEVNTSFFIRTEKGLLTF